MSRGIAIVCPSPAAYLACVLDLEEIEDALGGSGFPVLGKRDGGEGPRALLTEKAYPGSSSHRLLAGKSPDELLATCVRSSVERARQGAPCCVVIEGDEAALVGAVHALASGKSPLVLRGPHASEQFQREVALAPSVVGVLSARSVAELGLDHLRMILGGPWGRANENVGRQRPWGLLTASDIFSLSNLVARLKLRAPSGTRRGKVFWFDGAAPILVDDPELETVEALSIAGGVSRQLIRESIPFAVFSGHGQAYCSMKGNLCSRTTAAVEGDTSCVQGFDCRDASWPRIPARDLRVDVAMVASCLTANFQFGPEQDRNLAVHLLDGHASSVIASYRTIPMVPMTPFLVWDLVQRGLPLGEVCARLNETVATELRIPPPFVLLGDPEMLLFAGPPPEPKVVRPRKAGDGAWQVDLPGPSRGFETYECQGLELRQEGHGPVVHGLAEYREDGGALVRFLPGGSREPARILIAWVGRRPHGSTKMVLTTRPPFREWVLVAAGKILDLAREMAGFPGADVPKSEEEWTEAEPTPERDLEGLMRDLEPEIVASLGHPEILHEHYQRLASGEERILELCEALGRDYLKGLATYASKGSLWMYEYYVRAGGISIDQEVVIPEPCVTCGGSMQKRHYHVGAWPVRNRWLLECERCGFTQDGEGENGRLQLRGPAAIAKGETCILRIQGRNTTSIPALVQACIIVDRNRGQFVLDPEIDSTLVEAGGAIDFGFRLTPSESTLTHRFRVKGLVLINGSPSMTINQLDVRPGHPEHS